MKSSLQSTGPDTWDKEVQATPLEVELTARSTLECASLARRLTCKNFSFNLATGACLVLKKVTSEDE